MNEQFDPKNVDPEVLAQVPVVAAAHEFLLPAACSPALKVSIWE